MSQFNASTNDKVSYADKSTKMPGSVTFAPTNIFSALNISESQGEKICTDLGFPSATSVLDVKIKIETKAAAAAPAARPVLSAHSLLADIANDMTLSAHEYGLVQTIFGIVRQFASYSMNAEAIVAGIQSAVKRVAADAKKVIDFSKVIIMVNFRLQNSEHKNARVALQISSDGQFLSVRLNDSPEKPALLAPLCAA